MDDFRDHNQIVRRLARLEPNADQKLMRASRTNIQTYRQANGLPPLIDPKDWVPKDNRDFFDSRFVLDQGQTGSCVGFSDACAASKTYYLATGEYVRFSGAFVYALINGGSDNGAVITDASTENANTGQVLESQFGLSDLVFRGRPQTISPNLISAAAQYKSTFDMTVGSWTEVMTAIQMGFVVQLPIQVGNNFESFDSNGACGFSNGAGNHSVHVDGCILLLDNTTWALTMMNTWGMWGPRKDGRCLLYQRHVDTPASADDAFAHGVMMLSNLPQL